MRRLALLFAASLFFGSIGTGCIIQQRPAKQRKASKAKNCHPSQYWDGRQCRHKGKGKGSRKHDGPKRKGR
jgi:hypothetical protein